MSDNSKFQMSMASEQFKAEQKLMRDPDKPKMIQNSNGPTITIIITIAILLIILRYSLIASVAWLGINGLVQYRTYKNKKSQIRKRNFLEEAMGEPHPLDDF